ncbi:hypothetical protein QBC32DRAFT_342838 [Pseudoneurospora amorphoporcata]|uniref:Uncharacterized protein n=1 Tax=Pseudoneurospora amorphoporcata TaxID=241081 RepID=A0AAN6NTQ4_9PEZI|nr:hypothetical protein QBC32DRAFT_342838 [Pseudoneurospora amorphoporcata]
MGGSFKIRKFIGLKPKSSSANLQPQPITPDNFDGNDLNANGIYSSNNNGGYHSYTPNGSSAFSSNNYQPPGLSSISELPANDYGNGYTHHAPPQQHHHHQGQGHQHRVSLPVQARPGGPNGNAQYPHDPNGYYQHHHDRSSGNLSPQDAVHPNRDRRSASLGSRLSLGNFGSSTHTSSNSSLGGRSSVTTMSTLSSAATSPSAGPASPPQQHHIAQQQQQQQQQHPHSLSPGYQPTPNLNSSRYPGQPVVHQEPVQAQQQQQQQHEQAVKHRNLLSSSSARHRAGATGSQQYPPAQTVTQANVLQKPPYPVSERGSPPPLPQTHTRPSRSHLQSFANRSTSLLHPHAHAHAGRTHPHSQSHSHSHSHSQSQSHSQPQTPSAADIRRTTKLLRRMFELRLEQWALSHSHESDQHLVHEKRGQVDAVLQDILANVRSWGMGTGTGGGRENWTGGRENWTDEEWEDVCLVRDVLGELEMQFGGGGGGPMGYGGGYGVGVGIGGGHGMVEAVGGGAGAGAYGRGSGRW